MSSNTDILLPSTNPWINRLSLLALAACSFTVLYILTVDEHPLPLLSSDAFPDSAIRMHHPSAAPSLRPPTIPSRHTPHPGVQRTWVDLERTKTFGRDYKDVWNRSLPRCEEEVGFGPGAFGSFPERGYEFKIRECQGMMGDEKMEFQCAAFEGKKESAPSFWGNDPEQGPCRCGGIPLVSGECGFAAKGEFVYREDAYAKSAARGRRAVAGGGKRVYKPYCDAKTQWATGSFVHNRYVAPVNCEILDMNPRRLVKWFPNKLIFINGDSHMEDIIWAVIAEVRNQRVFAVPDFEDALIRFDVRYEVSEYADSLTLAHYRDWIGREEELRECKTAEPCTVFFFRFDRMGDDYLLSAQSFKTFSPNVVIAAFVSATYDEDQVPNPHWPIRLAWEEIFAKTDMDEKISFIWSGFPYRYGDKILANVQTWVDDLREKKTEQMTKLGLAGKGYAKLSNVATVDQGMFWTKMKEYAIDKQPPGLQTFSQTWHTSCHIGAIYRPNDTLQTFGVVYANELCSSPVGRAVVAASLTLSKFQNIDADDDT